MVTSKRRDVADLVHPGPSGCFSRTSSLLHGSAANVSSPGPASQIEVRFQLPLKSGDQRKIAFTLKDDLLVRSSGGGETVRTERRSDLNFPER
jgi:hypothetical protein